ncbi:MAG: DNA recombination protein RmuC [Phycisphaerales bacterium]|nr:DNA recombination protein RmuC [Phycisphaerales bacterium]
MELIAVALGVVALGVSGAAVWLWRERTRLSAEAERLREEARAAGTAREVAERQAAQAEGREAEYTRELESLRADVGRVRVELAKEVERREAEKRLFEEREASLRREREALERRITDLNTQAGDVFERLAAEALDKSQQRMLDRARAMWEAQKKEGEAELDKRKTAVEALVKPIGDTLKETSERLTRLDAQVKQAGEASASLRDEASKLVRALSRPEVRGRYGEIQLRRVAELAGMTAYCDFKEQASATDEEGRRLRPDMVVLLPNERKIAVDAKTPTDAYLRAVEAATPEEAEEHLERFAGHVEEQVRLLSAKRYWAQFDGSPEFVVMFVPGDQFVDAALARRPELLERAAQANVILASPSTLIGLLRAVAVGWREHRLAEEAQRLLELGRELHQRAATAFEHVDALGAAIWKSAEKYNQFVGSVNRNLLTQLKKFEDAGVKGSKDMPALPGVTIPPCGSIAIIDGGASRAID